MKYTSTTALITGASSGLGVEFAHQFAQRGADLVLVARRRQALEDVATQIRQYYGRVVHVVPMDLAEDDRGRRLRHVVSDLGVTVDTVINNAGTGLTKNFADTNGDDVSLQLNLNINAVVDISQAFLPQLLASGRGALINVASLTAYMPMPGMAIYAASKSFVLHFTEALAHELRDSALQVIALSPGPTRTDFFRASGSAEAGVKFELPADVVATVLKALETQTAGECRFWDPEQVEEPRPDLAASQDSSAARQFHTQQEF